VGLFAGWLLNVNNEVFRLVLDEATMQSLPMEEILDAPHSDAQSEKIWQLMLPSTKLFLKLLKGCGVVMSTLKSIKETVFSFKDLSKLTLKGLGIVLLDQSLKI
jgi:hypothetical protein